ncbi:MAG: hypothetical protein ISS93_00710 [Candidatus Aenigmarchaeota archaeon]|nr:hypothetical protein [Candidatus Aenigmarchaeota archaeon]
MDDGIVTGSKDFLGMKKGSFIKYKNRTCDVESHPITLESRRFGEFTDPDGNEGVILEGMIHHKVPWTYDLTEMRRIYCESFKLPKGAVHIYRKKTIETTVIDLIE